MNRRTRIGPAEGMRGSMQAQGSQAAGVNGTKPLLLALALAVAVMAPQRAALAMSVDLGVASGFAVLAGSGMTITGPTSVTGDIGTYPTPAITGMANLILAGVDRTADTATMLKAKTALVNAYNSAAGRTPTTLYGAVFDLGERTLDAGVYNGSSSLGITGTLTLDAHGDPNAVWIFQAGSTLIAEVGSKVVLVNGAQAANVFWQVGSSATLKTDAYFTGSILALTSITLNNGATVNGRVLAQNGAVTFDSNIVMVPEGNTLQLLGLGIVALVAFKRRRFSGDTTSGAQTPR